MSRTYRKNGKDAKSRQLSIFQDTSIRKSDDSPKTRKVAKRILSKERRKSDTPNSIPNYLRF